MDLIKLYNKRRYIIKTVVLVLIIIIAGIFYINPTKEDGSVIINKDNISDKESDSKSIIGGVTSGGAADINNSNDINGNEAGNDGLDENNSKIYVYICGAVVNAGVVSGGADMRLYQAVELCGGLIDEADGTRVNLAMQLKDGDKIYIPYAYDDISLTDEINNVCNPNATGISGSNTENSGGNSESYGGNTGGAGSSNLIDINKASKSELMQLSGIGEARALDIISYREKHGAFKRIEDIKNVSGIKDAAFNKIKDYICV
uniref:helix-hairpin-helix domain-containing protein n=1 Tax=[Lactobacillus] rogosae TaxID=706562 RepID=UPI003FEE1660